MNRQSHVRGAVAGQDVSGDRDLRQCQSRMPVPGPRASAQGLPRTDSHAGLASPSEDGGWDEFVEFMPNPALELAVLSVTFLVVPPV